MSIIEITADPIPEVVLAYCQNHAEDEQDLETELQAYRNFVARYQAERTKSKRIVMSNLLLYLIYSDEHDMKPSYALTDALNAAFDDEKKAKRNLYPRPIHQDIAGILTSSTYTVGRGKTADWKMHTSSSYSLSEAQSRDWFDDWADREVLNSYVSFGSHQFGIGSATQRILDLLEDRYGLNFRELEKQRVKMKR